MVLLGPFKFADAVGEDSGVFHCEEGAFPRNGARIMGRYSATLQIAEFILLSLWDSSVSLCKSIYAGCIIPRVQAHWLRIYYWVAFSYERMTGKHTNVNELFKYFWTWFQNICITLLNCCTRLQGYCYVLSQALDFPDLEAWETYTAVITGPSNTFNIHRCENIIQQPQQWMNRIILILKSIILLLQLDIFIGHIWLKPVFCFSYKCLKEVLI